MIAAQRIRRLAGIASLLVLAFCCLGYRLVDLQVLRHGYFVRKARENTDSFSLREPRRGDIRDIRGDLLATTVPVKTICADPSLLGDRLPEMAKALAMLLNTNETYLAQRLVPRFSAAVAGAVRTNQYVVLKRKVRVEEWQEIQHALAEETFGISGRKLTKAEKTLLRNLQHKTIYAEDDQLRVYPSKTLAAHVLGFVGTGESGVPMTGKDGIERVLNEQLSGARGWRQTEKDKRGGELVARRQQDVPARDGLNVVLTLDAGLQHIVESELAEAMRKHTPISVSAIVTRPRTGEILALVTLPNFDPNEPGAVPVEALRNRVISDMAEPGSTFKIVVVSGGLNEQVVRLTDQFDCERGRFSYAGKVLHDHESYGLLSVESIITKSSNIGAAKIGIRMGEEKLHAYIRNFGFGVRTGLPLPGEVSGIVHPVKKWSKVSLAQIPMGHGIASTPLQMVMAMSAIANRGQLMQPMLIARLEDANGREVAKFQPQAVRQVVSEAAAQQMVTALKTVVTPAGTAVKAKLDYYTVAGKTGTAQKNEHGVYVAGKYFSSFIGFFPADNPELCISVVMDEPKQGHYGGQTAAPFFHNIAERAASYLNIPPDHFKELAGSETLAVPVGGSNQPVAKLAKKF